MSNPGPKHNFYPRSPPHLYRSAPGAHREQVLSNKHWKPAELSSLTMSHSPGPGGVPGALPAGIVQGAEPLQPHLKARSMMLAVNVLLENRGSGERGLAVTRAPLGKLPEGGLD